MAFLFSDTMIRIECTLVGFRHHAWQGDGLDRHLAEARGKRVVLMRDEGNDRNRCATVVCIDSEVVGYVANDQCHVTSAYLACGTVGLLYGQVTDVDVPNRRCTATIEVEEEVAVRPIEADTAFEAWDRAHGQLPVMRFDDTELRLMMLQRDIVHLLTTHHGLDDTLRTNLEAYCRLCPYDVSREATQCRRQIADLLAASPHTAVRAWAKRIEVLITGMGSDETTEAVARYIRVQLPRRRVFADMARRYACTDPTGVEQALRSFPYGLYAEYEVSPTDFVSMLYYRQIPARVLRRFLSGVLLLECLRGRLAADGDRQRRQREVAEYVARIESCASAAWRGRTQQLWQRIADAYDSRLAKLNGAKGTRFNARFVCNVVGRLIDLGVYTAEVSQAEYGRRLAVGGKDMRPSVNKGLADEATVKTFVDALVRGTDG